MADTLAHRGPDSTGTVAAADGHAVVGMNTLAIISADELTGPYRDERTGCVLAYNGEIYNFRELARQWGIALGPRDTDAHLVLRAYDKLGADCISSFDGMFAFALYDPRIRTALLARDPLGEKPLYYRFCDSRLQFASETKALAVAGHLELSPPGQWLALETLLGSRTPYQGVRQLEPGSLIHYRLGDPEISPTRYWSLHESRVDPPQSYAEALDRYTELLVHAAHSRVPEVPFALMLSGGLDSAVLAYLMKPDILITVRYPGQQQLDELENAQLVADELGIELICIEPQPEDFLSRAHDLVKHLDYPLGNASVFSELMLYEKAARLGAKVVVGGLGPDELLMGYVRHSLLLDGPDAIEREGLHSYRPMADKFRTNSADRILVAERYVQQLLRGPDLDPAVREAVYRAFHLAGDLGKALTLSDLEVCFPALVLASDKLSSAFGLERRSPYLARDLVEFSYTLPIEYKRQGTARTKILLRDAASLLGVPERIWGDTNKLGFASPLPSWLGNELSDWCGSQLAIAASDASAPAVVRLAAHRALAAPASRFDRTRMQALLLSLWWSQHRRPTDQKVGHAQ
ncbi:asparagine synthase (glutamine-hydrolyzing) [Streptomyces aureus]